MTRCDLMSQPYLTGAPLQTIPGNVMSSADAERFGRISWAPLVSEYLKLSLGRLDTDQKCELLFCLIGHLDLSLLDVLDFAFSPNIGSVSIRAGDFL